METFVVGVTRFESLQNDTGMEWKNAVKQLLLIGHKNLILLVCSLEGSCKGACRSAPLLFRLLTSTFCVL